MQDIEEFDKLKTKVLKYVLYKKRTENEIRQKFESVDEDILDEIIDNLKENGYVDDLRYIERAVNEFKTLKHLSIKELQYKLLAKGLSKSDIENYLYDNIDELKEYELNSAKYLYNKKLALMKNEEVLNYLRKKGYKEETIRSLQEDE